MWASNTKTWQEPRSALQSQLPVQSVLLCLEVSGTGCSVPALSFPGQQLLRAKIVPDEKLRKWWCHPQSKSVGSLESWTQKGPLG